ncbi:hypothetical protein ISCGN_031304 [Ixodes scapularis]
MMNVPKACLLALLFATIIANGSGGSECDELVRAPWMCLTVSANDLHQNASLSSPRRTFTILLCSGPQCTGSITEGPHSFGHRIVDRLILFHANSDPSIPLMLPTGWLGEIRARDIEITGTLLAPRFLLKNPFVGQGTFLSRLVLRQCGLKGIVLEEEPSSAEERGATNATHSTVTVDDDIADVTGSPPSTGDRKKLPFENSNPAPPTTRTRGPASATSSPTGAISKTKRRHPSNLLIMNSSASQYDTPPPTERPPVEMNPEEAEARHFDGNSAEVQDATTITGPVFVTRQLADLVLLHHLDLSGNELTALAQNAFPSGLKELKTLDLSRNGIKEVGNDAFHGLHSLTSLNLSHNRLSGVQREMFSNPDDTLEKLDLSWNFLTDFPEDMFKNMYALREVRLSDNYLQRLPSKVWMPIWNQLTILSLTGNFIVCECDAAWLGDKLAPHAAVDGICSYPEEREGVPLRDFKRLPHCN